MVNQERKIQMATKVEKETTVINDSDTTVILRANRALSEVQFDLLSNLVRKEEKKAGVKMVLVPFSVDLDSIEEAKSDNKQEQTPAAGEDKKE